jgi:hypothetical protein
MGLPALLQLTVVIALAIGAVDPLASEDPAPWVFAAFMQDRATATAMIAAARFGAPHAWRGPSRNDIRTLMRTISRR